MSESAARLWANQKRGLVSSFSKNDLTFSSQALGSGKDEQYPDMSYENFWGDQYEWTALLPLAWKLVSTNGRIRPDASDHQKACCWWNVPLHLLGLGLGWTNIALGLQQWRELGYPDDNPVLRFIKDSYGTSIEALEIFLVTREACNAEFTEVLQDHAFKGFMPDDNLPAHEYVHWGIHGDEGYNERYLEKASARHDFGPRWGMAKHLLLGGYDPCHLSTHFQFSATFNETVVHQVEELDEIRVLFSSNGRIGIEAPAYKGFPLRIIQAFSIFSQTNNEPPIVSLFIKTLGHIGDFHFSHLTGRFFISDSPELRDEDYKFHLLGNIC